VITSYSTYLTIRIRGPEMAAVLRCYVRGLIECCAQHLIAHQFEVQALHLEKQEGAPSWPLQKFRQYGRKTVCMT
jgi:hypothetical protein